MGIEAILEASRAGMQNERLRMDQSTRSIASTNTPIPPATLASRQAAFAIELNGEQGIDPAATRTVSDPTHPLADAKGFVHYPQVDMVHEMTTLMMASRSYEANVRSFNILRSMVLRALELGAK